MAVEKLTGTPYSNIETWLNEYDETSAPNPMQPNNLKTTQKKTMDIPNMSETFQGLVVKVNELIDAVNLLSVPPAGGGFPPPDTGGRRGGSAKNIQRSIKTRPKPIKRR